MEAYAFCSIAHQWLTREFVQVLKIVSDTPVEPLVNFNAKEAQTLVENQVPAIDEFVHLLQSMVSELAVPSELASLSQKTRSLCITSPLPKAFNWKNFLCMPGLWLCQWKRWKPC